MNELELHRTKIQHLKVKAARMDLELTIMEKMADIERIKKSLEIQIQKELELEALI